jgi:16S rRNA (guanine(966)-N(2))-methyltransferase RsmD
MSPLRVIAGSARGTHLKDVPGNTTRPITDRVKEALFNILAADIPGSRWLDLFAGTGAVGIEALSRGADFVRFIDVNRNASDVVRENLAQTHLNTKADVLRMDAFLYLKQRPDCNYHYIYVAPPQYKDLWQEALNQLDLNPGWLDTDSWVIVQIDPNEYHERADANFREFETRRYGTTLLVFYERVIQPES